MREDDDGKSHGIAYKSGVNDSIGENRKGRRIDVQQAELSSSTRWVDANRICERLVA